jgi:hypothetical protein
MQMHGMSGTPMHALWRNIKQRVLNPKNPDYHHYGGRGIRICPEWETDFLAFANAVGPRPSPLHTLDRSNNDGHYEPGNVRWATRQEQSTNRRTTRWLEFQGKRQTLSQWAGELSMAPESLITRLNRAKLPVGQALSIPKGFRNRWLEFRGQKRTLTQWARELNLNKGTILKRLDKLNWPVALALSRPPDRGVRLSRSPIAAHSASL